ncbi:DMP19 family protein [Neisseria yangbaofengii]|uniref:DMP19 family protein n=1 Tax=Neisseria yangbaofengii TaxID=2709396 RepID=UPI0013EA9166|nr:DMP19 family protein [Neisseria yangbaofengii]
MTTLFQRDEPNPNDPAEFLYTLSAAYLDYTAQNGDEEMASLNNEQHTLTAYCYLDSQVQEGGFVQLIAAGYGEYIFLNPVADSLRRWQIKPTPKILDKAKALYAEYGEKIEQLAEADTSLDDIRAKFTDFEELDGEYYETADEDMAVAVAYVQANWDKFAVIED